MDFFMIHLRNVKNAFENIIVVIFLLFSYKRKETLEENEKEKTHDTFSDSTVSDQHSEELINQESREEADSTKITYHQPKTNHVETVNTSLHVIDNVINENAKDKEAPDPTLDIDFNSIENRGAEEKYYYGTIKDRMFNYGTTRDFWESISQLKK